MQGLCVFLSGAQKSEVSQIEIRFRFVQTFPWPLQSYLQGMLFQHRFPGTIPITHT